MIDLSFPKPVRLLTVVCCALLTSGCYHFFEPDENPPGQLDITEPPPQTEQPERVHPSTPPLPTMMFSARPLREFGWTPDDGSLTGTRLWGAEAQFGRTPMFPIPVLGATVGCAPCFNSHANGRRWYAELDARYPFAARLSAGWSYRSETGRHGPQVTVGSLGLHLRWYHHLGAGSAILGGFSIPLVYVLDSRPH